MSQYLKNLGEMRDLIDAQIADVVNISLRENRALNSDDKAKLDSLNAAKVEADQRYHDREEYEARQSDIDAAFRDATGLGRGENHEATHPLGEFLRSARPGESYDIAPVAGAVRRVQESHRGEQRAMDPTGGTGPDGVYGQLWEYAVATSQLLDVVEVINTADGNTLPMPVATVHPTTPDDPVEANAELPESDPTITTVDLAVKKYPFVTLIPTDLIQDASFDVEGYIARAAGRELGRRIGVVAAQAAVAGFTIAGVTMASGLSDLGNQSTAGQGSDYLIDLYHSVMPEYRADPSTAFAMPDPIAAIVRKLKDANGQLIWQPSLVAGTPNILLGSPVKIVPGFHISGDVKKEIFFGDWSALKVRIAGGIRIERSIDAAFLSDQVAYRVIVRAGGAALDPNAVKYLATPNAVAAAK